MVAVAIETLVGNNRKNTKAKDTGSAATSNVIACFQSATGLPVTPNGTDIPVTWDNGANKILALN